MTTLDDFLAAYFPATDEPIHLRAITPRGAANTSAIKIQTTRGELKTDAELQLKLRTLNKTHGLYFVVNSGGDEDRQITRVTAWYVESDELPIPDQHAWLNDGELSPSIRLQTKKSVHAYWLIDGDCPLDAWMDVQRRLIAFFHSDAKVKNLSRVMRLPLFAHLSFDEGGTNYKAVELVTFEPATRYTLEQMRECFPAVVASSQEQAKQNYSTNYSNGLFATWDELNKEARARLLANPKITYSGEWAHLRGVCHAGTGETAIAINLANGSYHCQKGCTTQVILAALGLPPYPNASASSEPNAEGKSDQTADTGKAPKRSPIYRVADFADKIRDMYENGGLTAGENPGSVALNEYYTIQRKQWSIFTGIPGHGKSAVLDWIMANLSINCGWRHLVCSPENQPLERHAAQLITIYTNRPFSEGAPRRITPTQLEDAIAWLDDHFVFISPDEANCTIQGILDLAEEVRETFPFDGFVIDPFNEIDHVRDRGVSETEYIGAVLNKLRRYVRANNLHLWVVAHPTKLVKSPDGTYPVPTLYDISGSAHFRNKSDMGVVVWRDVTDANRRVEIHIQKVRFRECGKPGRCDLYFDLLTGRFSDFPISYSANYATDTGIDDDPIATESWNH